MIRIILDKVDDHFMLDVLDTRNPGPTAAIKYDNYVDAATAAITAIAGWHGDTGTPAPLPKGTYGVLPPEPCDTRAITAITGTIILGLLAVSALVIQAIH